MGLSTLRTAPILAALLSLVVAGAGAEQGPYVNSSAYIAGQCGAYPTDSFATINHTFVPRLHIARENARCHDGRNYLFSSMGNLLMYDSHGHIVWSHKGNGMLKTNTIKSPTFQTYRGKQYLAYFSGDTSLVGHGAGSWHLLDEKYNLAYTVSAKNGVDADYHEFFVTEQNTFIFSAYTLSPANLTRWGGAANGSMWDSLFQEIDIETDTLIFEWRASDHYTFDDMVIDSYSRDDVAKTDGFDWFHINSIAKDDKGNYLVSSRYMSAVVYIDGRTGKPLWNLGGKHSDFRDVTSKPGLSVNFFAQHMPRWTADGKGLTMFDNAAYWGEKRRPARGLELALDQDAMTVALVSTWEHPTGQWAEAEGSMAVLPDSGNVLIGYGYQAVFAEYDVSGEMLCEYDFQAQAALFHDPIRHIPLTSGASYRIEKANWLGQPAGPPDVALINGTLFVSWNGATEVRGWQLETPSYGVWKSHVRKLKDSFETGLPFAGMASQTHLTALDAEGYGIGTWVVDEYGRIVESLSKPSHARRSPTGTLLSILGYVSVAAGVLLLLSMFKSVLPSSLRKYVPTHKRSLSSIRLPVYRPTSSSAPQEMERRDWQEDGHDATTAETALLSDSESHHSNPSSNQDKSQ